MRSSTQPIHYSLLALSSLTLRVGVVAAGDFGLRGEDFEEPGLRKYGTLAGVHTTSTSGRA
jgi:hypothetical protein